MSAIDPTRHDPTQPPEGEALTAPLRANEQATVDNFTAAKAEIEVAEAHIADVTGNPHAVTAAQAGADPAGSAAAVQTNLDAHTAAAQIHVDHTGVSITAGAGLTGGGAINVTRSIEVGAGEGITVGVDTVGAAWAGSGGDLGAATTVARSDHAHAALYEPIGALRNVVEDASPQLGGELHTRGNDIALTRADDSRQGILAAIESTPGAALIYSSDGTYAPENGGLTVEPGAVQLYGTSVVVVDLKHATPGGRQVYVAEDGGLFAVDPPTPGWTEADTDLGDYDIGGGTTVDGPWIEVTGLNVVTPAEVDAGDRLDLSVSLHVSEIGGRSGGIDVGFSLDASPPAAVGGAAVVAPAFEGYVNVAFSTLAAGTIPIATQVRIWARANNGSHSQYDPNLTGSINEHEFVLSTPGEGGGTVGEANVAANIGAGVGLYESKTGVTLNFKTLTGLDTSIVVTPNLDTVDLTLGPATSNAFTHQAICNFAQGVNARGSIDGTQADDLRITAGQDQFTPDKPLRLRGSEIELGASGTLAAAVGFAATNRQQASGGTFTPTPTGGQFVELTGAADTTIGVMAEDGAVSVFVPGAITNVITTGWTVANTRPAGDAILEARSFGTIKRLSWI